MADDIGENFKGLNMDLLIGGPLKAAADAQVLLSNATADFITSVCMNNAGNGNLNAHTENVSSDRGQVDNKQQIKEPTLDIPMLAVVKVPKLGIEEVDITFDREVKVSEADEIKSNEELCQVCSIKLNK